MHKKVVQKPWDFNTGKKRKTSKQEDLERIYIIVPEKITFPDKTSKIKNATKTIKTIPGMLMAQCSHVGRRLEHIAFWDLEEDREITTITLAARNSKEMEKLASELADFFDDGDTSRYAEFRDKNDKVYGKGVRVLTAIAIGPTTEEKVAPFIGHLELYGAE